MTNSRIILDQAITTQLDKFNSLLDDDLHDFTTRSLMADWYCDQGDYEAEECLRWQIRNGKRPYMFIAHTKAWWYLEGDSTDGDAQPDLPEIIFQALAKGTESNIKPFTNYMVRIEYHTRREAEEDLLTAWKKVGGLQDWHHNWCTIVAVPKRPRMPQNRSGF